MSQDCFFNSKDGKNFGSSRGLSGLVRLSESWDPVVIFPDYVHSEAFNGELVTPELTLLIK